MVDIAQAETGIPHLVHRSHGDHVDPWPHLYVGRQQQRVAHFHTVHRMPATAVTAIAMVHSHVAHVEQGRLSWRRDCRARAGAARQRCERHAGAVHALGNNGIGLRFARGDDHIVNLGGANLELIDFNRLHVLAVRRDHRHG